MEAATKEEILQVLLAKLVTTRMSKNAGLEK